MDSLSQNSQDSPATTQNAHGPGHDLANTSKNSNILTLTPADQEDLNTFRNNVQRNKQKQRQLNFRRQRQLRQAVKEESGSCETPYPKFYSLRFPRLEIEKKINVIAVDKDIRESIGEPAEIKKQSKDALLIKVRSRNQGNLLSNVTRIAGYDVEIAEHKSLNHSKGTVYSETLSNIPIEEIEEALQDQHVAKVERMKKRVNGELQDTHRYIITFKKPDLPRSIRITKWHHELVDTYIPKPMRCSKCQRIGHTQKFCRREQTVCVKCGEDGHRLNECTHEERCVNCGEAHFSNNNKCPKYLFQSEVLATQAKMRSTFHEALEEVQSRFRDEGKTYSFVARKKTPPRMREMSTPRSEETPRRVSLPPTQASSHTNTQVEAWNEQPEKTTTTIEAEVHVESDPKPCQKIQSQTPNLVEQPESATASAEAKTTDRTEGTSKDQVKLRSNEHARLPSVKHKTKNQRPDSDDEIMEATQSSPAENYEAGWKTVSRKSPPKPSLEQKIPLETSNRFENLSEDDLDSNSNATASRKRERKASPGDETSVTKKQQDEMNKPITTVIRHFVNKQQRSQQGSRPSKPKPPPNKWI